MKNRFKFTILLLLLISSMSAKDRASIALVLSGGGARGGAHVGVLKVLEENNIPIDFIVGTSMGSFVGGLYASGKTSKEIESILVSTDWEKHIRTDFKREDIPIRKKETEYKYQGKLGLGVDAKNNLVLPTGVLKRQPMLMKFKKEFEHVEDIRNFNELSIPFRAVATNIVNGEAVILKSGSLAKSVYASSAIPGGFQPISIDGTDLVDGGVSNNIPIDVAKAMGADIIIAVDVSENFDKNLDVNSYFVVMGQLINILMRKNANESIATLNEKDILITPKLKGFTGLDAHKYKEIIHAGVEATNELYDTKLRHLSISKVEYAQYKKNHKKNNYLKIKTIDKIVLNNKTQVSDEVILGKINLQTGDILDEDRLRKDILSIYNMGQFDSIDYTLEEKNSKNILHIVTTPSWDSNGEVRFAFGIEDDFKGHSAYSLKLGYTMFGLNDFGGEWKNDFEIGRKKGAYTEFFQPLSPLQKFYIKPSLIYGTTNELIPAKTLSLGTIGNYEMDVERYGATLSIGTHIFTNYEIEAGISRYKDSLDVSLLKFNSNYDGVPIYASLKMDNLDNLNFPNNGFKSNILWTKEMNKLGSDYDYEQIYLDFEKPITINSHNLTTYLKYGSTYKKDGITSLPGSFTLGGLFNLSGFAPYSLNNDNMFLGLIKYRYQLKDGGFFGSLNTPLYTGFSLEVGNTWGINDSVSYNMMNKSATLYLAADTVLGPFYLAYGFSSANESTLYLYLGENF
ncbi:patatin-like phospholipase family protein [Sulfurimonas sp.]|uniref:patatin-like phospholipase family protein n=1 Tax=Sulfurimonas sp. TaxID=2022749 RepID=UPI0039E22D49